MHLKHGRNNLLWPRWRMVLWHRPDPECHTKALRLSLDHRDIDLGFCYVDLPSLTSKSYLLRISGERIVLLRSWEMAKNHDEEIRVCKGGWERSAGLKPDTLHSTLK